MSPRLASRTAGSCAVFAALFVILGAQPAAAQCGGSQLCAPGAGDCTVAADCTITVPAQNLFIDLGARRLVITKQLKVTGAGAATLTIAAGDVVINGGTILLPGTNGIAGNLTIISATNIAVQNSGQIDASAGIAAGFIDLEALNGDINFSGRIKDNGTTRGGFGGDVALFATGNVTVGGTMIDVSGGDQASGGAITLDALNGSMVVALSLNARGGDGGDIEMTAGTTLQTTSAASMFVSANGDGGSGGSVDLSAVNDVTIGGEIVGTGSTAASSDEGQAGGDGADLDVFSEIGSVFMNGRVEVSGAAAGSGGGVDIDAAQNLTFTRPLIAQGAGVDGFGGDVLLVAGGTMSLPQQVDARGGPGGGGTIEAIALGDLTVSASLLANGTVLGGTIFLTGCAVSITSSGLLSAPGPGVFPAGSNIVQASSTMTISGTLTATTQNLLQHRAPPQPSRGGATITPPPTIQLDPTLPCCVNCPVTTTTTSTTSTTTLPTTSTTTITAPTTTTTSTTTTTLPTTTTTSSTTTTTTSIATTTTTTATTSSTTTTTMGSNLCNGGTVVCGLCETCDPQAGCVVGPRAGCRRPVESAKAQLKLKDSVKGPDKDQLTWKWTKGAATALADFGDPVAADGVGLCVFDRSQPTPNLLFRAVVSPGGNCGTVDKPKLCWKANDKNFKYANKAGNADGVTGVVLGAGAAGKAKVQLKGKGAGLTGRPFGLPAPPLPLPLTVQLQSENGQCWEADYSPAGVKKNEGEQFEAKGG